MLIKADRLYIVGGRVRKKGETPKTHLAYFERAGWGEELVQLCRPDLVCMACNSPCDGGEWEAGRKEAEQWNSYYNGVTCLSCLKLAGIVRME